MRTHLAARLATLSLLVLAPLCGGCGEKLPAGPVPPEYAEAPLKDEVKPFENALRVSNAILDLIEKGDTNAIYEQYLDPRLKQKATAEQFSKPLHVTLDKFGKLAAYKPMQWGFAQNTEGGMKLLYSTKIVAHERGWMIYQFQFEDDGVYAKLVGIAVQERKAGAAPAPR